jgi:CheY-like chemotaxis protein
MAGESCNILLVEDNASHAELVIRSLEDSPIPITLLHVSDGEQALDYLQRRCSIANETEFAFPHVILLDLRLPKIDGLTVLKEIKSSEKLRHIPVVILTSSAGEIDRRRAYSSYANSYLVKPVDCDTLSEMMNEMVRYWLIWNRRSDN